MAKLKVGMLVESGTPGTPEYDEGKITKVNKNGSIVVYWKIAEESYTEDPNDSEIRILSADKK